MRVSLPTLIFEYFEDRIVVTKVTPDADIKDPADGLMFMCLRCDFLEEDGSHVTTQGWIHYFNDK